MRIEQFNYLITIADCKSISKAAKQLYISQPALSNSMKELEKELGFRIFDRNLQGVALTENGAKLYEMAVSIEKDIAKIRKLAESAKHKSLIKVAATPIACGNMLLETVDGLQEKVPNSLVQFSEVRPIPLKDQLEKNEVDIALYAYSNGHKAPLFEVLDRLSLEHKTVFECPMLIFVSPEHELAQYDMLTPELLANYPMVAFKDYDKKILEEAGIKMDGRKIYTFADRGNIKDAVAHGKGFAMLPESMMLDDFFVEYNKIKVIPYENAPLTYLELVYHKPIVLSEEEKVVLDELASFANRMKERLKLM